MKYFKHFPRVVYNNYVCRNIVARAKVREFLKTKAVLYYQYHIADQDRPDIVSYKYYGSERHTWLIFYVNDMFDPVYDWPLTARQFNKFIESKYGSISTAMTTVHHRENSEGLVVDEQTFLDLPEVERKEVLIYDYENQKNEDKRRISLLEDRFASQVVDEFSRLFR